MAPAEEGQQPTGQNSLACYHRVQNNLWLGESSKPSKLILLFQGNCFSFNVSCLSFLLGCFIPHGSHAAVTPDPLSPSPWKQTSLIGIRSSKAQSWKSQLSLTPVYWRVLLLVYVILHGPLQTPICLLEQIAMPFSAHPASPCVLHHQLEVMYQRYRIQRRLQKVKDIYIPLKL